MKLFELFATLELQTNKFNDGINKAQSMAQSFAGKVQSTVTAGTVALGNLMARGAEVAINAVQNIRKEALNLTGQLEQVMGGSEAVFGVWAEDIQQKSSEAFKTMGLSAADYLETANKMGSLFQGSGFTTVESFEMTAEAMQRAADVASVMGIDTAWAMESIAGLAKGNYTMMDNLGVAINETTIAQYALEKGIKKSTSAMSTQEKVGLALELFMEKTEKYAGNRLRENDTIVGAIESANAAWKNLLSGAEDFTEEDFVAAIENAFNVVTRNMNEITPRLVNSFNLIAQIAIPKIKAAFVGFWNNDLPKLATSGANLVIGALNEFFGLNLPKIEKIDLPTAEEVSSALSTLWGNVTDLTSGIFNWTLGLFTTPDESIDHMGSLSTWWYGTALPFITDTFNWTVGIFQEPEEGVDPDGYIAQWWQNTVLPFLHETCTWALNMFLPPDENGEITPESVITGWWENVADSVVAACKWTLGLFGGVAETNEEGKDPKTIVEYWWGTIVDEVIKACEWALGIFSQPVETIDDVKAVVEQWWSGVVSGAVTACEWVLGLFKEPTATEGDAATTVYGWWTGVVAGVVDACQWVLGLFKKPTASGFSVWSLVAGWWSEVKRFAESALVWTLGMFGVPTETINEVKTKISSWWSTVVGAVESVCVFVARLFGFSNKDVNGTPIEKAIATWWAGITAILDKTAEWVFGVSPDEWETPTARQVSDWWQRVKESLEDTIANLGGIVVTVGKLVLGESLETSGIGQLGENVSSFLADLTGAINTAMGTLGNNPSMQAGLGVATLGYGLLKHPIITLLATIITNWETIKEVVGTVSTAVDEFLTQKVPEAWNTFVDGIKSKWAEIKSGVDDSIIKVKEFLGLSSEGSAVHLGENGEYGGASGERFDVPVGISDESEANMQTELDKMQLEKTVEMIPDMSKIPKSVTVDAVSGVSPSIGGYVGNLKPDQIMHKKAVGLNYVPYNEFPSLLHEGEAVLTKAEATAWRRGEGTGSVAIDYDRMADIVANAVVQAVSGLAIQMDKQTVGSIVSPVVFREMGRQLGSKRFAT